MIENQDIQLLGTILFALAVLHTFLAKPILNFSHRFPKGSGREALFHLLGEIEVVFGIWAGLFLIISGFMIGFSEVINYNEGVLFTEPIFVFCIMVISSTRPILSFVKGLMQQLSLLLHKFLRIKQIYLDFFIVLTVGPLAGSFITEPAAMTVVALILFQMLEKPSSKLMYSVLAVLFVNVSIGGTLTHFAAPPILMVASKWNWDMAFVFSHFGYKSILAVVLNALILIFYFKTEIKNECVPLHVAKSDNKIPHWVTWLHLAVLALLVLVAHYPQTVFGVFLFFLGITTVTKKYQDSLRLRESLLVAFFLGGIILFGAFQRWWLEPFLTSLSETALFYGAVGLTAITDNAALTYLGSQVEGLSDSSKYFLVAGAVAGGGLTVIANAPNAAGFSILQSKFKGGLNPLYLFIAAVLPTVVAVLFLEFLPHL
jgi:hypothetical protein